eukprot:7682389-Alexandrium_andersonii.AAC.1
MHGLLCWALRTASQRHSGRWYPPPANRTWENSATSADHPGKVPDQCGREEEAVGVRAHAWCGQASRRPRGAPPDDGLPKRRSPM